MLTVLEEPPVDGSDAHTDGDADDEGAGPSRLGPRFKQRTIDFTGASVRVRPPADTSSGSAAVAAQTLVIVTGVTCDLGPAATDPASVGGAAAGAADPHCEAAPTKRRRRKRRDADQQPVTKSTEDAPEPDREADAAEAPEPRVDRKQRTISFAAARPRAAPAAKPPPGIAPGEEIAAANPVDLTAPSPCDEDHAAPPVAAGAGQPAQGSEPDDSGAAARPKRRRQRKRSKAEQPIDAGSCEDIGTHAPAPSRAASILDPKQRTLGFAGAQPRTASADNRAANAESGAAEGIAAPGGGEAARLSASGARSFADAPAGPDDAAAAASVPAVPEAGPPTASQPNAASLTEGAPPKPAKRAYRKRKKQAADAAVPALDTNGQQSDEAALSAPTVAVPQPDPGQRKICFAAARPRKAASAVPGVDVDGKPADLPPDVPDADGGQSATEVTAAQREGVAPPCAAGCAVQHEVAEALEAIPNMQRLLPAEVCSIYPDGGVALMMVLQRLLTLMMVLLACQVWHRRASLARQISSFRGHVLPQAPQQPGGMPAVEGSCAPVLRAADILAPGSMTCAAEP